METVYDYNAQQTVGIYYGKYTMGPVIVGPQNVIVMNMVQGIILLWYVLHITHLEWNVRKSGSERQQLLQVIFTWVHW